MSSSGCRGRVADAAAGIDARADQKAEMPGLTGSPMRDIGERGQAAFCDGGREQALDHESAVEADERHHIADRRQRDEVEQLQQVRLRGVGHQPRSKLAVCTRVRKSGRRRRDSQAPTDRPGG